MYGHWMMLKSVKLLKPPCRVMILLLLMIQPFGLLFKEEELWVLFVNLLTFNVCYTLIKVELGICVRSKWCYRFSYLFPNQFSDNQCDSSENTDCIELPCKLEWVVIGLLQTWSPSGFLGAQYVCISLERFFSLQHFTMSFLAKGF